MDKFYKTIYSHMYGGNVAVAHAAQEILLAMPQQEIDAYTEWEDRYEGEEGEQS